MKRPFPECLDNKIFLFISMVIKGKYIIEKG